MLSHRHRLTLLACLALFPAAESSLCAQAKKTGRSGKSDTKREKPIVLSQRRSYRFEVGKIDDAILLNLERQWTFRDSFPGDLLTAIRRHPKKKAIKPEAGAKPKSIPVETGYIRWPPSKTTPFKAGALLWYRNGAKRKELIVGIDVVVGPKPAGGEQAANLTFDGLRVGANFRSGTIASVQFGKSKLPAAATAAITLGDTLEANVTGELSRASSRALREADELLSGELFQKLRVAAFASLKNESHHGITLGWLGHEEPRHNLMLLPGNAKEAIAFRYRVTGKPFPVMLIRRQIGPDGWPMVLTGHEYLGATEDGRRIFRAMEYQLSGPAKTGKTKK